MCDLYQRGTLRDIGDLQLGILLPLWLHSEQHWVQYLSKVARHGADAQAPLDPYPHVGRAAAWVPHPLRVTIGHTVEALMATAGKKAAHPNWLSPRAALTGLAHATAVPAVHIRRNVAHRDAKPRKR